MSAALFQIDATARRAELAADLARGGYVLDGAGPYFDKHIVLTRPGLLGRAADLLSPLVPADTERLAATGPCAAIVAAVVAQRLGVPLVLGEACNDGPVAFNGELFPHVRTLLIEDVVHTGRRALAGIAALRAAGAEVGAVVAVLDRQGGAAHLLAEHDAKLRALFVEDELLTSAVIPR